MLLDFLNILDILPDVIMASGLVSILGGMGTGTQSGKITFKKIFTGENISITDTGSSLSISNTVTGGIGIGACKIVIGNSTTGITGSIFCTNDTKYAIVGDIRILSSESPSSYYLRSNPGFIIGGNYNCTKGLAALIIGGCQNLNSPLGNGGGWSYLDSILGGSKNTLYQATFINSGQTILGGVSNTICESSKSAILGGYRSLIYASRESSTILGTGSVICSSNDVSIINSSTSTGAYACGSLILSSSNSQIGSTLSMSISSRFSTICGGQGNSQISSNFKNDTKYSKFSIGIANFASTRFENSLYSSSISSEQLINRCSCFSTSISSKFSNICRSRGSSIITSCSTSIISSSFSSIISSRGRITSDNSTIQCGDFSTMISSSSTGIYSNNICSDFSILSRVNNNYNYGNGSYQSTAFINDYLYIIGGCRSSIIAYKGAYMYNSKNSAIIGFISNSICGDNNSVIIDNDVSSFAQYLRVIRPSTSNSCSNIITNSCGARIFGSLASSIIGSKCGFICCISRNSSIIGSCNSCILGSTNSVIIGTLDAKIVNSNNSAIIAGEKGTCLCGFSETTRTGHLHVVGTMSVRSGVGLPIDGLTYRSGNTSGKTVTVCKGIIISVV
jgi:hypothetical protein